MTPETRAPSLDGPGLVAGIIIVLLGFALPLLSPALLLMSAEWGAVEICISAVILYGITTIWTVMWAGPHPVAWLFGAPAAAAVIPAVVSTYGAVKARSALSDGRQVEVGDELPYHFVQTTFGFFTFVTVLLFAVWVMATRTSRRARPRSDVPTPKVVMLARSVCGVSLAVAWALLLIPVHSDPSRMFDSLGGYLGPGLVVLSVIPTAFHLWTSYGRPVDTVLAMVAVGSCILAVSVLVMGYALQPDAVLEAETNASMLAAGGLLAVVVLEVGHLSRCRSSRARSNCLDGPAPC